MFGLRTKMVKVEVANPNEMADEIGELISLYHRTRKGRLLTDEPSFAGKHPELYRLYLELRVMGRAHDLVAYAKVL